MNTNTIKQQTPNYVTTAILYALLSFLASSGYILALYGLIGLLSLVTTLMVTISAITLQKDLLSEVKTKPTNISQNLLLRLLVQMIVILCIYQIYTAGFVFLAGMYTTTTAILITGTIVRFFLQKGK